jgi:hypothetical protein
LCGATLTNPYQKISKIRSAKLLDAALQHFYITPAKAACSTGGGVLGKQTK